MVLCHSFQRTISQCYVEEPLFSFSRGSAVTRKHAIRVLRISLVCILHCYAKQEPKNMPMAGEPAHRGHHNGLPSALIEMVACWLYMNSMQILQYVLRVVRSSSARSVLYKTVLKWRGCYSAETGFTRRTSGRTVQRLQIRSSL